MSWVRCATMRWADTKEKQNWIGERSLTIRLCAIRFWWLRTSVCRLAVYFRWNCSVEKTIFAAATATAYYWQTPQSIDCLFLDWAVLVAIGFDELSLGVDGTVVWHLMQLQPQIGADCMHFSNAVSLRIEWHVNANCLDFVFETL